MARQAVLKRIKRQVERVGVESCKKIGVWLTELRRGSRRGIMPRVRADITRRLVEDCGVAMPVAARQVGISISGVSKLLSRSLSI